MVKKLIKMPEFFTICSVESRDTRLIENAAPRLQRLSREIVFFSSDS